MKILRTVVRLSLFGLFGALWLFAGIYLYLSPDLPDVATLRDVKLQTPMRVYTREGYLIGQFGEQKRSPLPFDAIPEQFVEALLAAEDASFFRHSGVDIPGLLRAVSELVLTGEKGSGGSTLTMQVARNYFLSLERTFMRKFNEILLAIEIERALDKREIFELYFNRVFLGHRAYGFEAASQVYYGKSIGELGLAQYAMLAGIPKAPSRNNPISGPVAGKERRNWILGRMRDLGYINQDQYSSALAQPITATHHGEQLSFTAHYAAEMVRQEMLDRYGVAAYNDGYQVYTTIDTQLQQVARNAVINGLLTYDDRHGYRGPERKLPTGEGIDNPEQGWLDVLSQTAVIANLLPAVVTEVEEDKVAIVFADGSKDYVLWENGINHASPYRTESVVAPRPRSPDEVLAVGDLIRVNINEEGMWHLIQVPAAQAALVSLRPNDGAIISIVGGMGFELSKFNRATQAKRQPGSNFKPFLYSAALESGFNAASIINDAPVVVEDGSLDEGMWRPENDEGKFYGPTRLRWGLTKSRNLVSIRLLQKLGVERLLEYIGRFGFDTSSFPRDLSLALGTHVMSVMDVASAYAVLANGGYLVEPYLIDHIEDLDGEEIYRARPLTVCRECKQAGEAEVPKELNMEQILARGEAEELAFPRAPRIMEPRANFVIDSILRDVITKGTGRRALVLKRGDIAGKTGTTNGPMDAWFSGYNQDVVTSTWVGFDNYTPLGRREFGGTAALPIWIDFMRQALKDSPEQKRPVPPGIVSVRIDPDTGLLANPGQQNAIFEYFPEEDVPGKTSGDTGENPGSQGTDELVRDIF
jgi:penicillin-binding protein 1A